MATDNRDPEKQTSMMSCPKCGEDMAVMGADPSGDGKILKVYLVCSTCQIFAVASAKMMGRVLVNYKGDDIKE